MTVVETVADEMTGDRVPAASAVRNIYCTTNAERGKHTHTYAPQINEHKVTIHQASSHCRTTSQHLSVQHIY
jgi:hypothetical protein